VIVISPDFCASKPPIQNDSIQKPSPAVLHRGRSEFVILFLMSTCHEELPTFFLSFFRSAPTAYFQPLLPFQATPQPPLPFKSSFPPTGRRLPNLRSQRNIHLGPVATFFSPNDEHQATSLCWVTIAGRFYTGRTHTVLSPHFQIQDQPLLEHDFNGRGGRPQPNRIPSVPLFKDD